MWTREWIRRNGVTSDLFAVHYLQTPIHFGDVRIPRDRPAFPNAASFADLSDQDLLRLAQQRGFTGRATSAGTTVTWHHEIDYQPSDTSTDIGRLERLDAGRMYEHALDSSYTESWRSLTSGNNTFLVIRVERGGRLDRILLLAGDYFLYVRNRPADLPAAESLTSLITTTRATRAQIVGYLDCEFSTGRVRGGNRPWEIQGSTLPWREGRPLDFVDMLTVAPTTGRLVLPTDAASRWTVPVNTLSPAALRALFPPTR